MKEIDKKTQEDLFSYLQIECSGKENGVNGAKTGYWGYGDRRQVRRICSAINQNPDLGFVSTCGSIYACETAEEVKEAIRNTWRTAITYIKKARAMSKKLGQQGQYEFSDNETKIKIYFEEGEKE